MRGVGEDLGPAHHVDPLGSAGNHRHRRGGDHGARPQRVDGDAVGAELLGHPQHAHAHPVLRHRVGDVVPEPFRVEVERRGEREDVRIAPRGRRRLEMRQAGLRAEERAAHVDAEHQVEALHRRRGGAGEADRARVVDEDVDAAEALRGRLDRGLHRVFVADVAGDRQRVAARLPRSRRRRSGSFPAASGAVRPSWRRWRRWRRPAPRARRSRGRCRASRR